ncbi:hypothetical protein TSUD_371650 [Trifolium subterraneum]|uniref:RNase H type-1 domain-containing protein n=1 Tax=Trifolium subterraneum TaxID=3900 RepID=A0A2Z6P0S8_TRISU|nr:hypothetical protein TSUD_371650 [Trifolium subterraneum]
MLLYEYQHNIHENRLNPNISTPLIACHNKSWSPPSRDYLKLNVDAHLSNDGHWGLGLVFWREDGRCVGAAMKVCKGGDDVIWAETMGLQATLDLVRELQLNRVIIEMDAATVVRVVQSKVYPRGHWGQIARRCTRVFSLNEHLSINWVARSGITAAHSLAHWATLEPNKSCTANFPPVF